MKLRFGIPCFVIIAATTLPALARVGEPTDLLTNGGFEDGTQDWSPDPQHLLVRDSKVAHNGITCLSGQVSEPNRALRLRRSVKVKAGNRYDFTIWAKGTAGTKLVLWSMEPKTGQRAMVANWIKLTPRWRLYRTPISVAKTGRLNLEIISPSSHRAAPGRIWIDDIALHETEMPELVSVSNGQGFSDEPAMAMANDGTIYVAFNRFQDGADSLQIVRYRRSEDGLEDVGRWQVVGGSETYLLTIAAVATDTGVAVVYATECDRNWDIHLVRCGPEGPGKPMAVTSDAGVDVKPAATWHQGLLWVTWESNRNGNRQVLACSFRDSQASKPVVVSGETVSSYCPSIAVGSNGEICVAWHSFVDHNYDVYLRRRAPSGKWETIQRLTHAPSIDRHAVLCGHDGELWMVYENAQTERYYVTRTNRRRLIAVQVTQQGLLTPVAQGRLPLNERCEAASVAFDEGGQMWLSMLKPRLPRAGWDVYLTGLAGTSWRKSIPVSGMKGMDRRPIIAVADGRAFVAFQADDMPQSWSDLDKMADAKSDIFLADVEVEAVPSKETVQLEPLVESTAPFEPAAIRVERGEDLPTQTIRYKGETLGLYYGDLHEHSDVSVCNRVGDQSLDESYQHLRDIARHDFVCITDHGYNINPYLWNYSAKWARVNDDPRRFVTFLGQEWTSTFEEYEADHPYGFYGHRNLILADLYFPTWWNARNRQTPSQVWDDLRAKKANFVHIPHQLADTGNVPTDWSFHDEVAQPVAEIFQTRGSYEYFGAPRQAPRTIPGPGSFLQDAWAKEIVIGVIASPDHGGGYGKACVYAKDLSREAILDALRARRCYGTTAAKIFLDVRVNGHLMGEKIADPAEGSVEIKIRVRCPAAIDRVEICRSNQYIFSTQPAGRDATVTYVDRQPLEGFCYYYVRVIQTDEEIAWSSPVWFGTATQPVSEPSPHVHSDHEVHNHTHRH